MVMGRVDCSRGEHFQILQLGQIARDGIFEIESSVFKQRKNANTRDDLRHGINPTDRVPRHE